MVVVFVLLCCSLMRGASVSPFEWWREWIYVGSECWETEVMTVVSIGHREHSSHELRAGEGIPDS